MKLFIILLFSFNTYALDLNNMQFKKRSYIRSYFDNRSNSELAQDLVDFSQYKREHKLYYKIGSFLHATVSDNLNKEWDEDLAKAQVKNLKFPLADSDGFYIIEELRRVLKQHPKKMQKIIDSELSEKNAQDLNQAIAKLASLPENGKEALNPK